MKKITVALYGASLAGWHGGIDFMCRIANSLVLYKKEYELELYLLIPYKYNAFTYFKYLVKSTLSGNFYSSSRSILNKSLYEQVLSALNENVNIVKYYEPNLNKVLFKIKADVLLPVGPTNELQEYPIPHVGYIFDFQHKYFDHFFSRKECRKRDESFRNILHTSKALIVHSKSVEKDIKKFFPFVSCKTYVLPFVAPSIKIKSCVNIMQKLNIPKKFFLISNQFWQHKDHGTAFEALALIQKKFSDVHIVCTGKMKDYRNPGYFSKLSQQVQKLKVQDRIHFLGFLDKEEQIALMQKSLALISTTLFEGAPGGGAVGDAVALGIPVIISDISVNLEIDQPGVIYFKAGSSQHLAKVMVNFLQTKTLMHLILRKDSQDRSRKTLRSFGAKLIEAISSVLKN